MGAWAKIRINEIGVKAPPPIEFNGRLGLKKLIQVFVETHYVFFGRPNEETLRFIQLYTAELDQQKEMVRGRMQRAGVI